MTETSQSQAAFSLRERILRMQDVETMTGLKRSSIYRAIKACSFPKPVPLGARAVGFPESAVQRWIADRIASTQSAASK